MPAPPTTRPAPPRPASDPEPAPSKLGLSLTHVLAAALAAITATVVASFLGVTGTVIGAALASVFSTVGASVYGHSLRRTRDSVSRRMRDAPFAPPRPTVRTDPASQRYVHPEVRLDGLPPTLPSGWSQPALHARRAGYAGRAGHAGRAGRAGREPRPGWRRPVLAAVGVFAALLAVVTAVEVVVGRPISDLVRGDQGSGTTLFGGHRSAGTPTPSTPAHHPARHKGAATPTVTETVTPTMVTVTPTVTRTAPARTSTAPAGTTPAGPRTTAPTSPSAPSTSPTTQPSGTTGDTAASAQAGSS